MCTLTRQGGRIFSEEYRILASGIDNQFQVDLVDMGAKENNAVRYLLMCINVFSKYGWVRCLSNKPGLTLTKAFKDILTDWRAPVKLQTGEGIAFYNKHFQRLMEQYKITHISISNETKASVVEPFNRTFKTCMWRYLTSVNLHTYVDVVQELVKAITTLTIDIKM